jgi:osmotically-inducible protein OsmY
MHNFILIIMTAWKINVGSRGKDMSTKLNEKMKSGLTITSIKNVVYLSGLAESKGIGKLIQTIQSVKNIKDVKPRNLEIIDLDKNQFKDLSINSKIRGVFLRERFFNDKHFDPDKIRIKIKNGHVFLCGRITSNHALKAVELAKKVYGVKQVSTNFMLHS